MDGLFIDERGEHGPGTFLLNPEGFRHAPNTNENGNLIFVRLRQYAGERPQMAVNTKSVQWDTQGKKVSFEFFRSFVFSSES